MRQFAPHVLTAVWFAGGPGTDEQVRTTYAATSPEPRGRPAPSPPRVANRTDVVPDPGDKPIVRWATERPASPGRSVRWSPRGRVGGHRVSVSAAVAAPRLSRGVLPSRTLSPARARAALIPEQAIVFDQQWREVMATATETLDLTGSRSRPARHHHRSARPGRVRRARLYCGEHSDAAGRRP